MNIIIDKASWHIDGGEDLQVVLDGFQTVFTFLHTHQLLNADGEEIYELGIDSSISLHSGLLTETGFAFLQAYYDEILSCDAKDRAKAIHAAYAKFR